MTAVFLSLDGAGVPRHKAGFLERRPEIRVGLHESPRDAVTDGACLA
jgi:hypothetical protein